MDGSRMSTEEMVEHKCSNCKHLKIVYKHPANDKPEYKGTISEPLGHVCTSPEFDLMFFDNIESHCEVWESKE